MPNYIHYCATCETNFEVLRPMSESNKAEKCPTCDSWDTRRAYSPPGVIIKF